MDLKQKVLDFVKIDKLEYSFVRKPLLVSGVAMMYHGLRKSDKDIDLIISREDHKSLARKYQESATVLDVDFKSQYQDKPLFADLYGDHGILIYEFGIWDNIMLYGYDELIDGANEEERFKVISLEKLMFLSTIRGAYNSRYLDDAILIAKYLSNQKYDGYIHQKNKYWMTL